MEWGWFGSSAFIRSACLSDRGAGYADEINWASDRMQIWLIMESVGRIRDLHTHFLSLCGVHAHAHAHAHTHTRTHAYTHHTPHTTHHTPHTTHHTQKQKQKQKQKQTLTFFHTRAAHAEMYIHTHTAAFALFHIDLYPSLCGHTDKIPLRYSSRQCCTKVVYIPWLNLAQKMESVHSKRWCSGTLNGVEKIVEVILVWEICQSSASSSRENADMF